MLYTVKGDTDLNEGRGRTYTIGTYLDRGMAQRVAKGNYVMGTDCPIEEKVERVVVDLNEGCIYRLGQKIELSTESKADVAKRALSKLTPEERAALGFQE